MRLILHLQPDSRNACVPVHYNEFIQAMIYAHLDAHLAQALHDEGIPQGKRHLKLFTFSRLLGPCRVKGGWRSQAGWQNKPRSNREHLLAYLFSVWGSWGVPQRRRQQGRKPGRGRQDRCPAGQHPSALLPQGLKQASPRRMGSGAPPGLVTAPVLRTRTAGRRARSAQLWGGSTPSTRRNRRRCRRLLRNRRAKRALSRSVNRRFSAIRASSKCARSRSNSARSCWQFRNRWTGWSWPSYDSLSRDAKRAAGGQGGRSEPSRHQAPYPRARAPRGDSLWETHGSG